MRVLAYSSIRKKWEPTRFRYNLFAVAGRSLEAAWTIPIEELEVDSYLLLIFNGYFILGQELGINTAPIVNLGKGSRRTCHLPRWLLLYLAFSPPWRTRLPQSNRASTSPSTSPSTRRLLHSKRRLILGCCLLLLPPALPMDLPARQRRPPPCSSLPFLRRTHLPKALWWREVVGTIHAPKMADLPSSTMGLALHLSFPVWSFGFLNNLLLTKSTTMLAISTD
ncbi:hypothetical protein B0T18DRAFT_226685 [Schizothecium vesticola]|uniref:Uncharacterized protein n=1 Tax=Schizothecium vesticola TaxID=314040 RepID=A0AA40EKV2_9PEZI|nr:hypothetical protein B0T18DRAFT_226685 [Schizothecium vesticola]